jgi:hypothetical protein
MLEKVLMAFAENMPAVILAAAGVFFWLARLGPRIDKLEDGFVDHRKWAEDEVKTHQVMQIAIAELATTMKNNAQWIRSVDERLVRHVERQR